MNYKKPLAIGAVLVLLLAGLFAFFTQPPPSPPLGQPGGYWFGCATPYTANAADIGQYGAYSCNFTSTFSGTLNNMTAYIQSYTTGKNFKLQGAIYYASNLTFIANTTNVTVGDTSGASWETMTFDDPKPTVTSGVQYLLALDCNGTNGMIYFYYESNASYWAARDTVANAIYFANPWVSDNTYARRFCIYTSGTPSVGGIHAVYLDPGVYLRIGDTNYTTGSTMYFTSVSVQSAYVGYNATTIATSPSPSAKVNVTLNYLHPDPYNVTATDTLLVNFTGFTPTGSTAVTWTIGGLAYGYNYKIYRDGILDGSDAANSTGYITYTNGSGAWTGDSDYIEVYCAGAVPVGYGQIGDDVHDIWEYNDSYAAYPEMVRVGNSEYYLVVSCGTASDGFARTIQIDNDTGIIVKDIVDELEYDTTNGYYSSVIHIADNVYAILYGDGANTKVRTITVSAADGQISETYLDTLTLAAGYGYYYDLIHLTGNIYVGVYARASNMSGVMVTMYIDDEGNIGSAQNDSAYFNTTGMYWYARVCALDDDTVAVVWDNATDGDGWMATYNISAVGAITDTYTDRWEFATGAGFTPTIIKINGTMYAVIFRDSGPLFSVKTTTITDNGMITKSWTDTFAPSVDGIFFEVCPIHEGSLYAITYRNVTSPYWGRVSTINISANGTVGDSFIDTLIFETVRDYRWAPIVHANKSYYAIVWQGVDDDGWCAVVEITTNYGIPTCSPSPANNSYGASRYTICAATVADADGDAMDITWQENTTASWVTRQTNVSCLDGTYRWEYEQATDYYTKYWWKVWIDDGIHNVSYIFCFTTQNESVVEYVETIKVINHGLSIPPNMITITPINISTLNLFLFYVDNINSVSFTLHMISATGETIYFTWEAEYI